MLPDVGGTELLVIAAVALIVVGPKDLPMLLRKLGQWVAKMRGMAADFRASFDEMARQSELDELRKEVEAMRSGAYVAPVAEDAHVHQTFADIEAEMAKGGGGFYPPDAHSAPAPDVVTESAVEVAAKPARKPRARKPKTPAVAEAEAIAVEPQAAPKPRRRAAKKAVA